MKWILIILLVLAAGATLFVLVKGVIGMAQGKDITGQRSQELMRKRILFQAIAIVIAVLLLLHRTAAEGRGPGPAQQDLHPHRRCRRDRPRRRLARLQGRSAHGRDRRRRRGEQRDRRRPARMSAARRRAMLARIQNELFDLGADLATPGEDFAPTEMTLRIVAGADRPARARDRRDERGSGALRSFILPGGGAAAALSSSRARHRRAGPSARRWRRRGRFR